MAASPTALDERQTQDNWGPAGDHEMGPGVGDADPPNESSMDDRRSGPDPGNADYPRGSSVSGVSQSGGKEASYREKQVKPNKVYVGGLPEHTRQEDLQSCFGKIGNIVNIELKVGYGFVEFDSREAAETSVAKYHEGYFMGNKIRVELSHGGGRTAKYSGDPGACFKCGQMGHWARECSNHGGRERRPPSHASEPTLFDRMQPSRDYPPPPRDFPPYRDDPGPPGRYPPSRNYDYPPPPSGRDYRRPPTPPREWRDYPPGPPPMRSRDYDDYRMRGPPPLPPPSRSSYPDEYPGYPPRGYGPPPPPPRDVYDRYDRRPPPPGDRHAYPPSISTRPRTPPGGPPPRSREDYDRGPLRDYPAPPAEYRGRPITPPPRYAPDYVPRPGSPEIGAPRYRRRSGSPPARSSGNTPYDTAGLAGNGYSGGSGGPPRGGGPRDYAPRTGRDSIDPVGGSYRRP